MNKSRKIAAGLIMLLAGFVQHLSAQPGVISVKANVVKATIQPTMWGIFFEDINFGADGGLYGELVKNRSFEFFSPLMGWSVLKHPKDSANILILNVGEKSPNNARYAHITVDQNGTYGISNEGFRGMGVKKEVKYNFSLFARKNEGDVSIRVDLVSENGNKLGSATLGDFSNSWAKHGVSFTSSATDEKAHLNIVFLGKGSSM